MTTAAVHYPHIIRLQTGTGPNVFTDITQLTDVTPSHGFTDLVEYASGQTAPQFTGSEMSVPDITFTTRQLKSILDLVNTQGVSKDLSAANLNVDLLYKKGQAHGFRVADATLGHLRVRLESNTLVYWTGIRASQGSSAEMSVRLLPVWDTVNNPMVVTGSLALAGTSTATEVYTLGRIDLNGTDISAVQDVDFSNNIVPEEVADSGEAFISYGAINRFEPTLTFRSRDTTLLSTYGATGTALTSFEVYFRKRAANGINVADATTQHIRLNNASAAGVIKARQVSGLDSMVEVFVQILKPDAATQPFSINTGIAVT